MVAPALSPLLALRGLTRRPPGPPAPWRSLALAAGARQGGPDKPLPIYSARKGVGDTPAALWAAIAGGGNYSTARDLKPIK